MIVFSMPFWSIWYLGPRLVAGLESSSRVRRLEGWTDPRDSENRSQADRFPGAASLGFYSWNEVSCCSWSHFEPGMLIVHLKQTPTRSRPTFSGSACTPRHVHPPMYFFYRVPDFRGAVEKAIRACGKWSGLSEPAATHAAGTSHSPVFRYSFMDAAALRPAPMARITVAAPVTMSPPAKTPFFEVRRLSGSAAM